MCPECVATLVAGATSAGGLLRYVKIGGILRRPDQIRDQSIGKSDHQRSRRHDHVE